MKSDQFSLGKLAVNDISVDGISNPRTFPTRRKSLLLLGLLMIIILATVLYVARRPYNPIPKNISDSVTFPLYYPSNLSKGYEVDTKTMDAKAYVLTFAIVGPNKEKLAVTEQPKPKNFDFESFYRDKFNGEKEFLTPAGKATIGTLGDRLTASIVSDKTWIIVTTDQNYSVQQLEDISKGFIEAN